MKAIAAIVKPDGTVVGVVGRHRRAHPAALGQQADPGHGLRRKRRCRALRARQRAHRAGLRLAQRREAPCRDGAGVARQGRAERGRSRMRHPCAAPAGHHRGAGARGQDGDRGLQQLLGQAQRLPHDGRAVRRADARLHQVRPPGAAPPARGHERSLRRRCQWLSLRHRRLRYSHARHAAQEPGARHGQHGRAVAAVEQACRGGGAASAPP